MTAILNQIAEKWFSWQLSMFWQVGMLIVIVAGLDLLIKKWVWPQVRYALWLLILVKLVLPPTLTSPMSFTAEIPFMVKDVAIKISQSQTQPQTIQTVKLIESAASKETIQPIEVVSVTPIVINPAPAVTPLSLKSYVFIVWLAGVGILSGWLIIRLSSLRCQHLKSKVSNLPERLENLLVSTTQKMGLKKTPQVILTNKVNCPAVFGVFRPILLMPADKLQNLTTQDTENIFLHELAHIKRGDLFVHAIYMILQIAYWFNPLLWLIRKNLQNLRELCCDATVARILQEKTIGYRQTLLETARQLLAEPVTPGLGLLGLFENSSWLADRLGWLEKKSWKYRPLRITTVFVLICLMSAFVLPMTKFEALADFVIRGTVTDAQTGKPISGSIVGDVENYAEGQFYTTTDANGNYSYKTYYEEHNLKCRAKGYKTKNDILLTKLFGREKEKIINFALEPKKSSSEATVSIKEIMELADEKARLLNHEYIGTEHILLAVTEEKGAASDILGNAGINKDKILAELLKVIKKGPQPVTKKTLPVAPRAQQAIDYAVQQAGGEDNLNTGHILLGLMQIEDGVAAQVLKSLGFEKEKVINFALKPENSSDNVDYASVTVEEGVGFDNFIVGNFNCTGEFIKSKLGKPENEVKNEKTGWWLVYHKKYGLDFWVNLKENILLEIRLNKGFEGKLNSGISMTSSKQDVFAAYGKPVSEIEKSEDDFDKSKTNQILFKKNLEISKIYYEQKGLLFWFDGDNINQIVIYRKKSSAEKINQILTDYPADNHSVDFEITRQTFLPGDSIEITEIRGSADKISTRQTYTIKGKYKLSSADEAMLHLYATNGETDSRQGIAVKRGEGIFTKTFTYQKEGWLHLSFYPADGGSSFGNLYFAQKGSGQEIPDISTISSTVETSKPAGQVRAVEQAGSTPYPIVAERGRVTAIQMPTKENDYELIVNFDDDQWAGPCWYNVTINITPIETSQTEKLSIHVKAYIDGVSNLVFKKNSVYWHNLKWAAPGRHGGNNYPTYINGIEWIPQWPGAKAPAELRGEQKSKAFKNLPFSLPRQPANVQIEVEKPAGQILPQADKQEKTTINISSFLADVNAMLAEMQPSITEIQNEAIKLQKLKEQNAPPEQIKQSEKRIEELGKKMDTIGNKWGEKLDKNGQQFGKDVEAWAQEYGEKYGEQFGEKMAEWGRQFGEQMQRQYGQTGKTQDSGKNGFEKTETLLQQFTEGSLLVVDIPDGKVTVTGGNRKDCYVIAKIKAEDRSQAEQIKLKLKEESGKFILTLDNLQGSNASADIAITLPRKASLQCQIGDGSMTCSELEGQVSAAIGDGSVAIAKLLGNTSVKLGDGEIKYADSKGSFDAQLGDGKVVVQNAEFTEKCDVTMGDGQLIFENIRGKAHYEISVKDGTAKLAFAKDADGVGHIEVDVADGRIEFGCPANMSAKIEAGTGDGTIQTSLPLTIERNENGSSLDGTIGTGEGHIELDVKDGTIVIN